MTIKRDIVVLLLMSPTVFRHKGFRFYFFSLEEERMHVHVTGHGGDAKFWLDPNIECAMSKNIANHSLNEISRIIEEHYDEFKNAWKEHFRS